MADQLLFAAPPEDDLGWDALPDVIPDWVLEPSPLTDPFPCDCCGNPDHTEYDEPSRQRVMWATPGVTGRAPITAGLPPVSEVVAALQATVQRMESADPTELDSAQALADAQAMLGLEQRIRVLNLRRVADVGGRGLHELVGFRSTKAWLRTHRPDGDSSDAALGAGLRDFPTAREAVDAGTLPLAGARQVVRALRKVAPHVDRPDGLIDGQPADAVIEAVVHHVVSLICRSLRGLTDDDPRLAALLERGNEVLAAGSQLAVLEAAFTWLASELPARHIAGPLDELVVALLPSDLEDRGQRGYHRRGLSLTPYDDGSGWHLRAELDLECGEQLWVALRAEAARDPRNPQDTADWADGGLPRSRRERLHDALQRLLGRYLEHGLGGTSGKVPVQVHVTLSDRTVDGAPGAPPPRGDSGRLIPRALVRRWWCDTSVTAFVLSLGGKALRVIHSQRTLTADERRALAVEGGDRCVGDGCCSGLPDPLVPIRGHHLFGYAEDQITCLDETLPVCDVTHRDVHEGKIVRLRDGRYLSEHGFVDAPSLFDHPPF